MTCASVFRPTAIVFLNLLYLLYFGMDLFSEANNRSIDWLIAADNVCYCRRTNLQPDQLNIQSMTGTGMLCFTVL